MVGSDGHGAQFRPLAQKRNKVLFGIPWQVMLQNQMVPELSFSCRLIIFLKFGKVGKD